MNKKLKLFAVIASALTIICSTQAVTTGELAFSDGTDDWFSEVTPGAGDTFNVEFNPFDLNFVTTQNGLFSPPFDGSPVQGVAASVGEFEFVESTGASFKYALTSDLVFDYDNGATVTWMAGSLFEGLFLDPGTVEFDAIDSDTTVTVTGLGTDVSVVDSTLQFSDISALGGGTYNAEVNVSSVVPESSTTIHLFLIAIFALGFMKLRYRFQS